jgi:hypothetical protein
MSLHTVRSDTTDMNWFNLVFPGVLPRVLPRQSTRLSHWPRWGAVLYLLAVLAGCAKVDEYDAVDRELAASIKPSSLLADAEKSLGQPHAPSPAQTKSLAETLQRMPAQIRQNAEADRTLAWGNDHDFLVVKVNEQGTIWVVTTRFGGSPPLGH